MHFLLSSPSSIHYHKAVERNMEDERSCLRLILWRPIIAVNILQNAHSTPQIAKAFRLTSIRYRSDTKESRESGYHGFVVSLKYGTLKINLGGQVDAMRPKMSCCYPLWLRVKWGIILTDSQRYQKQICISLKTATSIKYWGRFNNFSLIIQIGWKINLHNSIPGYCIDAIFHTCHKMGQCHGQVIYVARDNFVKNCMRKQNKNNFSQIWIIMGIS